MRGRSVFVTGGTGFIGSHLVSRLAREGAEVFVLARPDSERRRLGPSAPGIHILPGDLLDPASLERALVASQAEVVFHLAVDTSCRRLGRDFIEARASVETNLLGTLNLVGAVKRKGPHVVSLVRTGTLAEYGRGPFPFPEGQREEPTSPYAASQVAETHYCRMLQAHLGFALPTLRLALTYGPAQSTDFVVPALIASALRHDDFVIANGDHMRDLLYVDDVVEALLLAGQVPDLAGEIINVTSGSEHRIRDIAATVWKLTESKGRLSERAGTADPTDMPHFVGPNDKALARLGWSPSTGLLDGLKRTVDWYRGEAQDLSVHAD